MKDEYQNISWSFGTNKSQWTHFRHYRENWLNELWISYYCERMPHFIIMNTIQILVIMEKCKDNTFRY